MSGATSLGAYPTPELCHVAYEARRRECTRSTRADRSHDDLSQSCAQSHACQESAHWLYAQAAVSQASEMLSQAGFHPAWKKILEALRLCYNRRIIWLVSSFFVLWFRFTASRLKRRFLSISSRTSQTQVSAQTESQSPK